MGTIIARIRRTASSLDTFCALKVKSGALYCPLMQTYDNNSNAYVVDRSITPTVIVPVIRLTAKDGSVTYDSSSSYLTNIKWYVQRGGESSGTDITQHAQWTGLYSISSDAASRGVITLTKNIQSSDSWTVWMQAEFDDERTGSTVVVPLSSEKLLLSTTINTESPYTMSTDRQDGEIYDMLLDKRIEFDYRSARGLLVDGETFTDDGNTYLRKLTVKCWKGQTLLVAGTDYTIKIERVDAAGVSTVVTTADYEINAISGNVITFDLRWLLSASYRISCLIGTRVIAFSYYGYIRSIKEPDYNVLCGTSYDGNSILRTCKCVLSYNGNTIKYPEAYCDISWSTQRQNGSLTYRGSGESISLDMTNPDVISASDNNLSIQVAINLRGVLNILTDESGNILTDESGNILTDN